MSEEKFDYSLWVDFETWRSKDAFLILSRHITDRAIARGDSKEEIKHKMEDVKRRFERGIHEFSDNIIFEPNDEEDDDYDDYQRDPPEDIINHYETIVNKVKFIRWAYGERIPLPDVIMNIVRPSAPHTVSTSTDSIGMSVAQDATDNKEPAPIETSRRDYCFIKTAQSWNLVFGDVPLEGVKDLVGMDYIQVLLKNPGVPIGVYQIQAMTNPLSIKAPESKRKQEADIVQCHSAAFEVSNSTSKNMDTRSSKSVSLENLKKRLLALSQERNELDEDCDHIDLERIDNEYAQIEAEIDNIIYSKNDDPELKRNYDKVSKNINKAFDNIKILEEKKGHKDAPMYNFLKCQIKTASECLYTPPAINPPVWSF